MPRLRGADPREVWDAGLSLPNLRVRLVPNLRCLRCGQMGYVEQKSTLCCACLNISLLRYLKLHREGSRKIDARAKKLGQA